MTAALLALAFLAQPAAETRAIRSPLAQEVAAIEAPAWLTYTLPSVRLDGTSCWNGDFHRNNKVALEGFREVQIYIRVEGHRATKFHHFTPDCEVDAGGLPVIRLTGVSAAQSVAFLESQDAVHAIGPHLGPEADAALERFLTPAHALKLRKDAAFWLGSTRGARGVQLLTQLLRTETIQSLRDHAIFAMSRSKEGIPVLISMARERPGDRRNREKAVFWLARSNDPEARKFVDAVLSQ